MGKRNLPQNQVEEKYTSKSRGREIYLKITWKRNIPQNELYFKYHVKD